MRVCSFPLLPSLTRLSNKTTKALKSFQESSVEATEWSYIYKFNNVGYGAAG